MKSFLSRGRWCWAFAICLVAVTACEPAADIPQLPNIELANFSPMVREHLQTYLRHVENEPKNAKANGQLAMILHANEHLSVAAALYARAEALDPDSYTWPYYLGTLLSQLGEMERAESAFRRAIALDSDDPHAPLALAALFRKTGERARSRELYENIIGIHPDRADAHFGYATLLDREDRFDKAIHHYQRALELNGPFGQAYVTLAEIHRRLGDAVKRDEALAKAEAYRDNVLDGGESLPTPIRNLRVDDQRYVANARRLARKGRFEDAIADLGKALERDPGNPEVQGLFIQYYTEIGDWVNAEAHFHQALETDPNCERLHLLFGNLRFAQKRYPEAAKAFEDALAINPDYVLARVNLGVSLEWQGEADRAAKQYRRALRIDPNQDRANHRLARYLAAEGRYAEAIQHFERTLAPIDEETPRTLRMMGQIHMLNGSIESAISTLERAKQIAMRMDDSRLAAMISEDLRVLAQALPPK